MRKQYNKKIGKLAPMNKFNETVVNAIYGDLVSLFFYTSNTIVGNNITVRAKTMECYIKKSLHVI